MAGNCQCHYRLVGSWYRNEEGVNVPCWRCPKCDAFQEEMGEAEAQQYRTYYWAQRKEGKKAKDIIFVDKRDIPATTRRPAAEMRKSTTGTQLSLFEK